MAEIKKKQQLEKIINIIVSILEEKEGYTQVYDLQVGNYYFAIPRTSSVRTDWTSLYVGRVHHKAKDYNYFEDLHNPVTDERFEDSYHDERNFIFSRIEYDHYSFIKKYKMNYK